LRPTTPMRVVYIVLVLGSSFISLRGADDALPADIQPALRADFSADGLMTWWLVSPPIATAPNTKAPTNARDGELVFPGQPGTWSPVISESFFNDLRLCINGTPGSLFASARVHSDTGGQRIFYIRTYCAIKVYLDGALLLTKPQPEGVTVFKTALTLPKGLSEIVIEIVPRGDNCIMQCLIHDGRGNNPPQKPVAGDSIVLPSAKGKVADVTAAALKSLSVGPKSPFIAPGGKATIIAMCQGSLPRGVTDLTARLVGPTGTPLEKERPLVIGEPFQTDFTAPAELRGVYEVHLEILAAGKSVSNRTITLMCLEGLAIEAATLENEWLARSTKSGHSMPNVKLAIEKIKLFADGIQDKSIDVDADVAKELTEWIDRARRFMPVEEQGKDPYAGQSGYIERGYTSVIDGGVQPYITGVPEGAAKPGNDTFPLVIFLHGYDPNMNKHRWWEARDYATVCARNNCLLAIPFGRLNTDFQSCGEVDVLDVIKEMKAHYRVDPDRVYLVGISMGGMGVSTIAAHYPNEFAASIVIAGRADSPLQNYTALENFHPFKQWLIHADNPISLCENLINMPLRIYHGQDDNVVPVSQATRLTAALKKAGCNPELLIIPGGHRAGFELVRMEEPVQWLLKHKRNLTPATERLKTYSLQFARRASIKTTNELTPIDVEWKSNPTNGIEVLKKSANVLEFSFPKVVTAGTGKYQDMCGPVRQAFRGPFTIVYGTKGSTAANDFNKKNAERFEDEWFQFTRSHAHIKADVDVTPDEKRDRNFFLFGEEQDNTLHAELAKNLPISVKNGSVKIGEKTTPLDGKGILYIYPSEFSNRKHAVVICAGMPYGEKIGVNHKLDLVPDFLLYEGAAFDSDGTSTNTAACAGFFDPQWKLDTKTMWWAEKK